MSGTMETDKLESVRGTLVHGPTSREIGKREQVTSRQPHTCTCDDSSCPTPLILGAEEREGVSTTT
jgi:hypothetical protein